MNFDFHIKNNFNQILLNLKLDKNLQLLRLH